MTHKKQCNNNGTCEDNNNKNVYDLDYIFETCAMCGIELIRVEDIMVDENDQYICKDCKEYHHVKARICADIN